MALFLSRSTHKVDKKGRVSVPAAFRAALGEALGDGIALTKPVSGVPAIEATPMARVMARIEQLDMIQQDTFMHQSFSMVTLGNMRQTAIDGDGRMILPDDLMNFAGVTDSAVFIGLGRTFQIWEAERLETTMREAEEVAKQNAEMLPRLGSVAPAPAPASGSEP
jgi:MraZ protein